MKLSLDNIDMHRRFNRILYNKTTNLTFIPSIRSIIATHSIVTSDVPENSIYGGVPAKLIMKDIHKLDVQ